MTDTIDSRRAEERGRGRGADAPRHLGWTGWKDVLWRALSQTGHNRVPLVAGGVAFFLLLALVPTLSALVSLYGLFFNAADVAAQMGALSAIVPAGGLAIIDEQLTRLTAQGEPQLGWTLLISLVIALWSSSAGMKALFDAMNIVNGEAEKRNFFVLNALALLFTLAGIVGAGIAVGIVLILPAVLGVLGLDFGWLIQVAGYLLLAVLLFVGTAILYRFGPSRRDAKWRWLLPGAILSVTVILAVSALFSWYAANFANYDKTYGSLGALIAFLTWMWISVAILVVGAALNAEAEHQTARDSTISPERPMGARGAHMADTLGRGRQEKD